MKRQAPVITAPGCAGCPAFRAGEASVVEVRSVVAVSGRMAAQMTDGAWNAVVTTRDHGTFLIRRSPDRPADVCPLRAYEIRHIVPDRTSRPDGIGRDRAGRGAGRRGERA